MGRDPVWVLMAWDGPKPDAESWEPIAVFTGPEPSMLQRGRSLIAAERLGQLPWDFARGAYEQRPIRIDQVTTLRQIRDELVLYQ